MSSVQLQEISTELLRVISQRTKIPVNQYLDTLSAKFLGFAQHRELFDQPVVANTEIFPIAQAIKPKLAKSLLRIQVEVNGTAKIKVNTLVNASTTKKSEVLDSTSLTANIPKSLDYDVVKGKSYNIEFTAAVTINHLYISEIPQDS